MKPVAACLVLLLGVLAGRELHRAELSYLVATARSMFRVHGRDIRARDFFGHPSRIACPVCYGRSRLEPEALWCRRCGGANTIEAQSSTYRFVEIAEPEPSDYSR